MPPFVSTKFSARSPQCATHRARTLGRTRAITKVANIDVRTRRARVGSSPANAAVIVSIPLVIFRAISSLQARLGGSPVRAAEVDTSPGRLYLRCTFSTSTTPALSAMPTTRTSSWVALPSSSANPTGCPNASTPSPNACGPTIRRGWNFAARTFWVARSSGAGSVARCAWMPIARPWASSEHRRTFASSGLRSTRPLTRPTTRWSMRSSSCAIGSICSLAVCIGRAIRSAA